MDTYMTSTERADRLTHLEIDVSRLVRIIDGENGGEINPGIVGVLRRETDLRKQNTERIVEMETAFNKAKWTFAGFAAGGGLLGGGAVFIIQQIAELSG